MGILNQELICKEETTSVACQDFYESIPPHLGLGIITINPDKSFLKCGNYHRTEDLKVKWFTEIYISS